MPENRENRQAGRAQLRADLPPEQEAVRTTIVGGRPPGSGKPLGPIPRGLEILVKKASVDPEFRRLLLENREKAAESICLALDLVEDAMLRTIPDSQLETVIDQIVVPNSQRRVFLGRVAGAMLAVLTGTALTSCGDGPTKGIRPDEPLPLSAGILPDMTTPDEEPEIPEHRREFSEDEDIE